MSRGEYAINFAQIWSNENFLKESLIKMKGVAGDRKLFS